ncbi:MAG: hypothetical protein ACYDHC_14430 [Desulfuromonadaceae bacterium]
MEFLRIKSIDELPVIFGIHPTALKRWFKTYPFGKHSDCHDIKNKLLVGKPVIAAFMGISEKTLKRWFVKYPDMPIERTQHRCYAFTNNLMLWKVRSELQKTKAAHLAAANDWLASKHAAMMDVSKRFYLDHYIRPYYPNHPFLKLQRPRTRCYAKTMNKVLKLLFLSRTLLDTSGIDAWYKKLYF